MFSCRSRPDSLGCFLLNHTKNQRNGGTVLPQWCPRLLWSSTLIPQCRVCLVRASSVESSSVTSLNLPSAALYVIECTFLGVFDSHTLSANSGVLISAFRLLAVDLKTRPRVSRRCTTKCSSLFRCPTLVLHSPLAGIKSLCG
jgi:hypothetical protein